MTQPRPRQPDRWLTIPQIVTLLPVSKMTVYRLVHKGELIGYRIGGSVRVRLSDLNAYLAGQRMGPGGAG
jgi:excisionase family DNA binding protein